MSKRAPILILVAGALLIGGVLLWRHAHRPVATKPPPAPEEHCDANGWCTQSPAHAETMRAVWVAAPNDVWTVDMGGSAWHFDGVRWTSRYTGIKFPEAVYGFGSKAVWIVGSNQAVLWNGSQFVSFNIPVRGDLSAVFGTQVNDVWASTDAGVLAHWNGQNWSVVGSLFAGWLHAIWGASNDDLWVAGGQGGEGPSNTILHYDGRTWTPRIIPCSCDITGLSGTARDDVWAVGSWGTILHFDGREWSRVPSPAPRGLTGVWAASRNDAWAVGEQGMVLHFDGKAWVAAKPDWKWFWGIAGTATRELWAVGQDGWILHWHGDKFRGLPKPGTPAAASEATSTAGSSKPPPPNKLEASAAAALARARKLQSEGKFEQAKAAYVLATGRGETINLRPLAEYAYAMLLQDDKDTYDDVENMLLASTKDDDRDLQAQAWFNLALLYAKRNLPEAERAALARSLARRDHPSARAKLKGRSSCVAEIGSRYITASVKATTGWKGVCAALGLCNPDESLTAAQARQRACVTSPGTAGTPDQIHGCAGDGPWTSTYGYSNYRNSAAWIASLSSDHFLVANYGEGSWPAICEGESETACERSGDYAVISQQHEWLSRLPGRSVPQSNEPDAACMQQPVLKSTGVFAMSSAKLLAAVTVVEQHLVELTVNSDQRRLELSGGDCNGYVALDGTMRWVPHP